MASQANPPQKAGSGMTAPGPTTNNDPIVPDGPRPDRNSAVSFHADASVSVNTYIDAMTDTLAGVHSASRISHGRVAVYFSSRQAGGSLTAVQEGFFLQRLLPRADAPGPANGT